MESKILKDFFRHFPDKKVHYAYKTIEQFLTARCPQINTKSISQKLKVPDFKFLLLGQKYLRLELLDLYRDST